MANRNPTERNVSRDQSSERVSGTDRQKTEQQTTKSAGAATSDRERSVETSREQARRESTGLTRRAGAISPGTESTGTPFGMMRRMMDDMDRLFSGFGVGRSLASSPWRALDDLDELSRLPVTRQAYTLWTPPLEVFERGNDLVIRADLPGISKDDVNVEVENGVLTVSGERRQETEDTGEGYYRSERSYGAFSRSLVLPDGVDEDKFKATFKDGVLEVTMPKPRVESSRKRRIDIK